MRVAAVDLGSNSFHLLVVEVLGPSSFQTVLSERMMIQLGRTALLSGRLDLETMERGLRCLDEFRRLALARRVERVLAVATSAIREASNGEEFLRRARDESGLTVRIISGREEARLVHRAVARHMDLGRERILVVDIGGGSVELIVGDGSRTHFSTSRKLGFLRLQGRFGKSDPMSEREASRLVAHVRESLAVPLRRVRALEPTRVIVTSGSMTALLRLAQRRRSGRTDADPLEPCVSRSEIADVLADLGQLTSPERARKFDLHPLRAETLPIALRCLDTVLEDLSADSVTVCPVALREGLIYDYLERGRTPARLPQANGDPRLQAVMDLARRCDYPAEHSHHVAILARRIFEQTKRLHRLGEEHRSLLEYAAILHDIGYHVSYAGHHKHAHYLVANGDLSGFTLEERAMLANLVRYHRRSSPKARHPAFAALPPEARRVVRSLVAILRIADGLDRSHFARVQEVQCAVRNGRVRFQVQTSGRRSGAELDLHAAKDRAAYFEKLFGVETVFTLRPAGRASRRPARKP